MKKSGIIIILIIISASTLLLACCGRGDGRLSPFRWQEAGGDFDSLTIAFDRATYSQGHPDTLSSIAARMAQLSRADSSNRLKRQRADFARGVALMRQGRRDEAKKLLSMTRSKIDSARYPYDAHRVDLWIVDALDRARNASSFRRIEKNMDFYRSVGDSALLAIQYADMGLLFKSNDDIEEARRYFTIANRLFNSSGLHGLAQGNMINISSCAERLGDEDEGMRILRGLVADSSFQNDIKGMATALHNIYSWSGDTSTLRRALAMLPLAPGLQRNTPLWNAELSDEFLREGRSDSARVYSDRAIAAMENADLADSAFIFESRARLLESIGMKGEAASLYRQSIDLGHRYERQREKATVTSLATSRKIAEIRMAAELEREHRATIWITVAFSMLTALLITLWMIYRKMQRQKMRRIETQLELETTRSKMMSMQIAEKNEDEFLYTFATINPNFSKRLKEAYPNLTPMDLKLAAFAAMGLDIKQIARILGIRAESVKQSRWRLRVKLGAPAGIQLDELLKPYLE